MDNEQKKALAASAKRGRAAEQLRKNPLLMEALESLEKQFYERFRRSKLDDDRERLVCRIAQGILDRLAAEIDTFAITGKADSKRLAALETEEKESEQ